MYMLIFAGYTGLVVGFYVSWHTYTSTETNDIKHIFFHIISVNNIENVEFEIPCILSPIMKFHAHCLP